MNKQSDLSVLEQVIQFVRLHPNGVGRSDVALDFGIHKSTAAYHLEKAVARGRVLKTYTWTTANSRGWIYYFPVVRDEVEVDGPSISISELVDAGFDAEDF